MFDDNALEAARATGNLCMGAGEADGVDGKDGAARTTRHWDGVQG